MKMLCQKVRKKISLALDNRLEPVASKKLQAHLHLCPSCRSWQQEQLFIQDLFQDVDVVRSSCGFYTQLQNKIEKARVQPRLFGFQAILFKPVLLRAAMLLIMIFAAAVGFSLGDRLDTPAINLTAAAFNQTMNLDAFADLPIDSFGAVYDRLLQGDRP